MDVKNANLEKIMPVQDAKSRVRDDLIEPSCAMAYAEPEKEVRSRSGDVCVVALCDQVGFLLIP
mgnify:CR=1 FL=1